MKNFTSFLTVLLFVASLFSGGCTFLKSPLSNAGNAHVDKRFNGTWTVQNVDSSGKLRPMREQKVSVVGRHLNVLGVGATDVDGKPAPASTGYLTQLPSGLYLSLNNCSPTDSQSYLLFRCEFKDENTVMLATTTRQAVEAGKKVAGLRAKSGGGADAKSPLLIAGPASETQKWLETLKPQDWEVQLIATRKK